MNHRIVLLVDDDPDVHLLVKTHFRRLHRPDLTLAFASDGRAALARLAADGPSIALVLTDVNMPRLDGHGLIRAARTSGYTGPILLIGALATADHEADEWVDKDHLLDRLPVLVTRYLG